MTQLDSLASHSCASPEARGIPWLGMIAIATVLSSGCMTAPHRPPLIEEVSRQELTHQEVGYPLFDFVARFSRVVESTADGMVAANPDPQIRRNALLWKINAVPAALLALEHQDHVAMVIDLWVFCLQMTAYLETGAGQGLFGDQQPVAIAAARELQGGIGGIAAEVIKAEALPEVKESIAQWAETHPLEDIHFARTSILSQDADLMNGQTTGLFGTVNTLAGQAADLRGILMLQADQMPRLARWQAELLIEETSERIVGALMTNAFALIGAERAIILESVDRQRKETIQTMLEAIQAERLAILEGILHERKVILLEVGKLVTETLDEFRSFVTTQRIEVAKMVDAQRRATIQDLRTEPLTLKHDVDAVIRSATDLVFGRLVILFGVSYVVLLGTLILGYFILRKPRERTASSTQDRTT